MTRLARRIPALLAAGLLLGIAADLPVGQAIPPPHIDRDRVPADGHPGPDEPMRQDAACARPMTIADPDVAVTAPGFTMLNVSRAWQYSTGNGVPVAVVDTGVNPSPRLPVIGGGDYIMGGDGLSDCDAHGTVVASVIAAAPRGMPMPPPRPVVPAFPAPEGAVTEGGPPPPAGPPPPVAPPPQPAPVTVTVHPSAPPPPAPPPAPADSPADHPANGPDDAAPDQPDDPEVPPPPPDAPDGVVGVAPHAVLISIRQSSRAYSPEHPGGNADQHKKAGTLSSLASAIVHAADMGAKVINVSVTACVSAEDPMDQGAIGAAVWYAATVKDAVVVAAAGNDGEDECAQNPSFNPLDPADPRDWQQVVTVSSPSWFSDYVLSVGAVDNTGAPLTKSLAGPWVAAAAPGVGIIGLSPVTGGPVNAHSPTKAGQQPAPFWGTSFSAAYVSGVAALVRARYPDLSAHQVINRILQTAHNPPRGVDNQVGYGVVDPVAALTFDVPPGDRIAPGAESRLIVPAPPPPPPDYRARNFALAFAGGVVGAVLIAALVTRARRARRQ